MHGAVAKVLLFDILRRAALLTCLVLDGMVGRVSEA